MFTLQTGFRAFRHEGRRGRPSEGEAPCKLNRIRPRTAEPHVCVLSGIELIRGQFTPTLRGVFACADLFNSFSPLRVCCSVTRLTRRG
jgi:hypothetical protein